MEILRVLMIALLAVAAVNFILSLAKYDRVRVIEIDEEFSVRHPRVYAFLCLVFFILVSVLVLNMVVWRLAPAWEVIIVVILAAMGVPFLLLSVVWKIRVKEEYIVYVNMFGAKQQIYYKDIKRAVLTRTTLLLETTLKTYRFSANVVYREYFLKRLSMNGVEIDRYDL